jgi:hypothetical protein
MPPVDCASNSPAAPTKPTAVIFVFVNIRAKRRARHIGVDLVTDRNDPMTNHFQGDRIDLQFLKGGWRSCLVHGDGFFSWGSLAIFSRNENVVKQQ